MILLRLAELIIIYITIITILFVQLTTSSTTHWPQQQNRKSTQYLSNNLQINNNNQNNLNQEYQLQLQQNQQNQQLLLPIPSSQLSIQPELSSSLLPEEISSLKGVSSQLVELKQDGSIRTALVAPTAISSLIANQNFDNNNLNNKVSTPSETIPKIGDERRGEAEAGGGGGGGDEHSKLTTTTNSQQLANYHHLQLKRQQQQQQQLLLQHHLNNQKNQPVDTKRRQLMIGQHYNNFSSIVPYNIVQDSDYNLQNDQLIDEDQSQQGEEEEEQQIDNNNKFPFHFNSASTGSLNDNNNQLITVSNNANGNNNQHHYDSSRSDNNGVNLSTTKQQLQIRTNNKNNDNKRANSRALLPLDSNRLILPQMQQIKSRFNQGCVGGTKCQFFAFCWMSGGSLGASCGLLMTCCVTPSRQEIQPGFYGPVVNDPYCGRSTSKINRIVGGTDASFGQFPWQAFVQVGGSRCGGALISSRHVVTAGHCVARSQHSPSSIKVTLGDYILNSDIESIPHEVFSVVEVLLHPNFRFTPQADRYDVAVLELDRTASYKDNIKPICLPQKDATFVGRVAYVAGWGALQAGSKLRPKVLQHVAVPVIENNVCESWHRRKGIDIRIYDEMMCAGYESGQRDACQGDSGGPLMLNQFGVWYLVGIVSAGYSCAKQYQPGIYHRVSSSSDWISSNIYQQGANK